MPYCAYCGNQISIAARFCSACGASNGAIQQAAAFTPICSLMPEFGYQTNIAIADAEYEYKKLKSSFTTCLTAGAVFAVSSFSATMPWSLSTDVLAVSAIMLSVMAFFAPFGFVPIKNFVRDRGWFIIFTTMFLVLLCVLVATFCVLVGPFYFAYMISRLKKLKAECRNATEKIAAADAVW